MKTYEEVQQVAKFVWKYTINCGWWADHFDNYEVKCYIDCSDVFVWGCGDDENMEVEDLELYESVYNSLENVNTDQLRTYEQRYTELLYCCKKRGMRPQGAIYTSIPREIWHLFNECGAPREVGLGNPKEPGE